jgi:hypothetical protein
LETTHLLGTEDNKLESIIQSILKGIHYGDKIPPVPVYYHSIKEAFVLADHFDG